MTLKTIAIPSIDPARTVAFSGYRPQKIMESLSSRGNRYLMDTIHRTVLERLKVIIRLLYKEGYDVYLTGMADGFDIWGGEAVLEMQSELPDLKLVAVPAYIPRTTKDTAYYRMYARIMAASAQVYEVCPEYKRDCFDRRNEVLVSNCSTLVCYFDGIKGGTANTIAKASKRDLRIINVCLNRQGKSFNHNIGSGNYIESMAGLGIRA